MRLTGFIAAGILLVIYAFFDPLQHTFFPACPFRSFTGLECPGCGSQRALHHLLNFQFLLAFRQNPLLVLSIPYLLLNLAFSSVNHYSQRGMAWRTRLFGTHAILFILALIVFFWIFRNF